MDIITLLIVLYGMALIHTANLVNMGRFSGERHRQLLGGLVLFFGMIYLTNLLALPALLGGINAPPLFENLTALALSGGLLALAVWLLRVDTARYVVQAYFQRIKLKNETIPFYSANNAVHLTALIMMLMLTMIMLMSFVAAGGTEGVAQGIESGGIRLTDLILPMLAWLIVAFRGVGYGIHRTPGETFRRLGLRLPTPHDIRMGVGGGILMLSFAIIFSGIWQSITPPEVYEQQNRAAEQFTSGINTLALMIAVTVGAAVGEEIFIRGALQPIFGIPITSVFFVMLHAQYLFAPSMLLLFAISIVLGILRDKVSTTSAMIAHFTYNMIPLLLLSLVTG